MQQRVLQTKEYRHLFFGRQIKIVFKKSLAKQNRFVNLTNSNDDQSGRLCLKN
jgi:hypothetical protein